MNGQNSRSDLLCIHGIKFGALALRRLYCFQTLNVSLKINIFFAESIPKNSLYIHPCITHHSTQFYITFNNWTRIKDQLFTRSCNLKLNKQFNSLRCHSLFIWEQEWIEGEFQTKGMDSQVMELTLFNEERRFHDNNNNRSCNSNNNNNQHNNDNANNHLELDLSQIQRQCNTLEPPEHMHKNTNTYKYRWDFF